MWSARRENLNSLVGLCISASEAYSKPFRDWTLNSVIPKLTLRTLRCIEVTRVWYHEFLFGLKPVGHAAYTMRLSKIQCTHAVIKEPGIKRNHIAGGKDPHYSCKQPRIKETKKKRDRYTGKNGQRSSALDVLDGLLLVVVVPAARKGLVRGPARRRARGRLLQHAVDLLEREALGLRHAQVREQQAQRAAATPGR